jgi:hypothetical protein
VCKYSGGKRWKVTLLCVGAVQFSKQRSDDHWEVRLDLVHPKIHCCSTEELKDACPLKVKMGFI